MITKTIAETRTYRIFDEYHEISTDVLNSLIELARLAGSARNCQPWQYVLINTTTDCAKIFPHIRWAGYLIDWDGPVEGQRPTAYIICILNKNWLKGTEKEAQFDLGISSQNILLGATDLGLGGCRIGAFSKDLASLFPLEEKQSLELVIALGKPAEKVQVDAVDNGDIKYWRDESELHHVPKRSSEDVVLQISIK